MYFKLYYHHYRYNTTCVSEADGYSSRLVNWVNQQKELHNKGLLTKFRTNLLNELGMDWTIGLPSTWDDMYHELVEYHQKFGSTVVSKQLNRELGMWTFQQRNDYLSGGLNSEKIAKLERLDFAWYVADVDWNAMADRVDCFQQKYNNTVVPWPYGEDPPLGKWVINQRKTYGKYFWSVDNVNDDMLWGIAKQLQSKRIPAETLFARLRRLTNLGFVWDANEAQWMEMYQRLIVYKEVHNSTRVPPQYQQDLELVRWVSTQRRFYDEGLLTDKRITLLDDIEFVWDPLDARWNEMFERLIEYKGTYGSTMVPTKGYKKDPELGEWVSKQRLYRKEMGLSQQRLDKLDSIGFVWVVYANGPSGGSNGC
jgi:hypothetical protein